MYITPHVIMQCKNEPVHKYTNKRSHHITIQSPEYPLRVVSLFNQLR